MTREELACLVDHTLLKPEATEADIKKLCREAGQYKFFSVCVNPSYVKLASKLLRGSGVKVCTVVGFPLGANATEVKIFEAQKGLEDGASEVDMVANIGALRGGNFDLAGKDIMGVAEAAKEWGAVVKVILETGLLSDGEIAEACKVCEWAGADFVKTSTGFGPRGASVEDVRLIKRSCRLKVKASGGIRNLEQFLAMIEAGADRIGTSAGVAIISEFDLIH